MRLRAPRALLVTVLCAGGCTGVVFETPLPTFRPVDNPAVMCAGTGIATLTLRGNPTANPAVWLEHELPDGTTERLVPLWSEPYRARFSPGLELVSATGEVVMGDGWRLHDVDVCQLQGEQHWIQGFASADPPG